jgi:hypothetical protein
MLFSRFEDGYNGKLCITFNRKTIWNVLQSDIHEVTKSPSINKPYTSLKDTSLFFNDIMSFKRNNSICLLYFCLTNEICIIVLKLSYINVISLCGQTVPILLQLMVTCVHNFYLGEI